MTDVSDETMDGSADVPSSLGDGEPAFFPGTLLGSWRVVQVLGEGGMGRVYLAEHTTIGRRAAIKVLKRSLVQSASVQRFFDEARAVNHIRHPGIVDVTDLFEANGQPCIVMELLPGQTLAAHLQTGRIPSNLAIEIALAIADALAAAHAVSIVHRDLKPDNVMVTSVSPLSVKILDFGVAKLGTNVRGPGVTSVGAIVGTPEYMAPEQLAGTAVDHRVDIYALGLVLFEMLAGLPPFRGNSFGDWVVQHMTVSPPDLRAISPDLPPELSILVGRMLEKEPSRRPATMHEVRDSLRMIASSIVPARKVSTVVVEAKRAPQASSSNKMLVVWVGVGLALAVMAQLVWRAATSSSSSSSSPPPIVATAPPPSPPAPSPPSPPSSSPSPLPAPAPEAAPSTSPPTTPEGPVPAPVSPPVSPPPPPPPVLTEVPRAVSTAKLDQVVELWRKKGFRKGDVEGYDAAAARGKNAARAGDAASLEAAIKAARAAVETTEIDKAFVSRKLARLNPVLEAMADGDVKTRISGLAREAVKLSQKGDPVAANGKLNEAFSLAGR